MNPPHFIATERPTRDSLDFRNVIIQNLVRSDLRSISKGQSEPPKPKQRQENHLINKHLTNKAIYSHACLYPVATKSRTNGYLVHPAFRKAPASDPETVGRHHVYVPIGLHTPKILCLSNAKQMQFSLPYVRQVVSYGYPRAVLPCVTVLTSA